MRHDSFEEDWEKIKYLAFRLQAIFNLLGFFEETTNKLALYKELNIVQQQLMGDINQTMDELIKIIEKYDF